MQQEAAQELLNRHGHQFLLVPMGIILPAECHFAIRKRNQSMVGYSNAMRIACQVVQNIFRSAKGRFCIHNPLVPMKHPQKGTKRFLIRKVLQVPGQTQFALAMCAVEAGDKFTAEHAAEHATWKEKSIPCAYPGFVVRRQTACRNHAVNVRMMEQVLPPGMKDAEKANLSSQVFRIGGNLQESCGAGSKQKCVNQFLIMKRQKRKCVRNRKNQMDVWNGEEFPLAGRQPLLPGMVQTLRTMPIPAAVVRDGCDMTASRTTVPVSSKRCRPATLDGRKHFEVQHCQPGPMFLDEAFSCRANDVRHLERRPHHWGCFLPERFTSATSDTASVSSGFGQACKWRRDKCK